MRRGGESNEKHYSASRDKKTQITNNSTLMLFEVILTTSITIAMRGRMMQRIPETRHYYMRYG